jgi:hypothetical protein
MKPKKGKVSLFAEKQKMYRQRGNSLLNLALKMNYVAPLTIFLMMEATQLSMNWYAIIRKKNKMLSLNWTFFIQQGK